MILKSTKIKLLVTFAFLTFVTTPVALAQTSLGFSVSPVIFDMTANPDQVWKSNIRIINANPYEIELYLTTANFTPRNENGVPDFSPVQEDDSATFGSWISVPEVVRVSAETTTDVPVVIYTPPNADPGGHFAAVLIGNRPTAGALDTSRVSTSQVISTLFFLTVTGDISEVASIRSFRTAQYLLKEPETSFEIRLENTGNVHLTPTGAITIHNMWGKERGVIPINPDASFGKVLPKSIRQYSFDWSSDWSIADIGRYTAKVNLSYGSREKQSLVAETAFWVLPWTWVLLTLGIIAVVLYSFIFAVKLYIRRTLELAGFSSVNEYQRAESLTPKSKRLNLTAPFETGLLDLRNQLSRTSSVKEFLNALYQYMRKHWQVTIILLGLILVTALVLWYMGQANQERDYTVTAEDGTLLREVNNEPTKTVNNAAANPSQNVVIINRTGSDGNLQEKINEIQALGYVVEKIETAPTENLTVIVYAPSRSKDALRLSALLDNAPISALPDSTNDKMELTVFLGADMID